MKTELQIQNRIEQLKRNVADATCDVRNDITNSGLWIKKCELEHSLWVLEWVLE